MFYTPGPKAVTEYESFTQKRILPVVGFTPVISATDGAKETPQNKPVNDVALPLLSEMTRRGISEKKARELIANLKPDQAAMDQLEYVDGLVAKDQRRKLDNPPGLYVLYVRDNMAPPASFPTSRTRRLHEQARQEKETQQARTAQLKLEYDTACATELDRYIREELSAEQSQQLLEKHRSQYRNRFSRMSEAQIEELAASAVRMEVTETRNPKRMTFEEFVQTRGETVP